MRINTIESPNNHLVKKAKSLHSTKGRKETGEFLVEGNKFVLNIPKNWQVVNTIFSQSYAEKNQDQMQNAINPVIFKENLFNACSDTVTPSGVMAIVKIKNHTLKDILACPKKFIIIACNLQDPGNMGTLIRTANAASASGIIVSPDSVDIWNPKVVRSAAGSIFNLPIAISNIALAATELKSAGIELIATDLSANISPYQADFKKPLALMIGNESRGLCAEQLALSDTKVKLPMSADVESLNASVASGVLMYEVLRQRGF